MGFKSFDITMSVIDEASDRFKPLWEPDREKINILKQYCGIIDDLIKEFDGESFDVEIDEVKMTISIKVECADITIESQKHKYYDLIQRTVSFGFIPTDNDTIAMELVFPSVWNKAV